ncbi:MAG TPA: hypothetical protein VH352_27670, partial [Pseudonocardiaceae bacterium]|nr:hypothetical protein [Pseudonocardiaceae bacterium]
MRVSRLVLLAASALAASAVPAVGLTAGQAVISPDLVHLHPIATHVGSASSAPLTTAQCEAQFQIACYGPAQIQRAYNLPALFAHGTEGQGQTIAIVDSFGSPTIEHDLKVFDQTYNLPAPKLTIIQPAGPVPPYDGSSNRAGWAGETNLDVEWAHAMAPKVNILLV